ncbi:hypothetical protein HU200_005543 [Digitaria exilis]|uniref:DUF1618 domain-containing protein n=1 Tax=Digitaria exilis TaxID=1010633 RepID=A0A835FSK2_9POAL|nr:hypothetical protein HU200_005543 [Digitaria exilis]
MVQRNHQSSPGVSTSRPTLARLCPGSAFLPGTLQAEEEQQSGPRRIPARGAAPPGSFFTRNVSGKRIRRVRLVRTGRPWTESKQCNNRPVRRRPPTLRVMFEPDADLDTTGSYSTADPNTLVLARTSSNHPLGISLRLASPPAESRICPSRLDNQVIAAHGDSVLIKVSRGGGSDEPKYFVYNAHGPSTARPDAHSASAMLVPSSVPCLGLNPGPWHGTRQGTDNGPARPRHDYGPIVAPASLSPAFSPACLAAPLLAWLPAPPLHSVTGRPLPPHSRSRVPSLSLSAVRWPLPPHSRRPPRCRSPQVVPSSVARRVVVPHRPPGIARRAARRVAARRDAAAESRQDGSVWDLMDLELKMKCVVLGTTALRGTARLALVPHSAMLCQAGTARLAMYTTRAQPPPAPHVHRRCLCSRHALGISDDLVVACLKIETLKNDDNTPKEHVLEMLMFRSGKWWKIRWARITGIENGELGYFWSSRDNPRRRQHVVLVLFASRNVCVTSVNNVVKFVNMFARCSNVNIQRIATMTWVLDGVMDCTELWALDAYKSLPRVRPEFPVVSMDEPHAHHNNSSSASVPLEVDDHPRAGMSVTFEARQPGSRETFTLEPAFPSRSRLGKLELAGQARACHAGSNARDSATITTDHNNSPLRSKRRIHCATPPPILRRRHRPNPPGTVDSDLTLHRSETTELRSGRRTQVATLEPELEGVIPDRIVRGMGSTVHLARLRPECMYSHALPLMPIKGEGKPMQKGEKGQQGLRSSPPSPILLVTPYYEQHETGAPHHCWTIKTPRLFTRHRGNEWISTAITCLARPPRTPSGPTPLPSALSPSISPLFTLSLPHLSTMVPKSSLETSPEHHAVESLLHNAIPHIKLEEGDPSFSFPLHCSSPPSTSKKLQAQAPSTALLQPAALTGAFPSPDLASIALGLEFIEQTGSKMAARIATGDLAGDALPRTGPSASSPKTGRSNLERRTVRSTRSDCPPHIRFSTYVLSEYRTVRLLGSDHPVRHKMETPEDTEFETVPDPPVFGYFLSADEGAGRG